MVATYYAWDPEFDCITKETDSAGSVTARYTQEPKLHGGLISQHPIGASSYYHYDNIGTTRALTNSTQAITDTAVYTAFGQKAAATGTTASPFGFAGKHGYYNSTLTEGLYVRSRIYDKHSRWKSVDWIQFEQELAINYAQTGFESPYCYSGNRPTAFIDPSGLAGFCEWVNWAIGHLQRGQFIDTKFSLGGRGFFIQAKSATTKKPFDCCCADIDAQVGIRYNVLNELPSLVASRCPHPLCYLLLRFLTQAIVEILERGGNFADARLFAAAPFTVCKRKNGSCCLSEVKFCAGVSTAVQASFFYGFGPFVLSLGYFFQIDGRVCYSLTTGRLSLEGHLYGTPMVGAAGMLGVGGWAARQAIGLALGWLRRLLGLGPGGDLTIDHEYINYPLLSTPGIGLGNCNRNARNCAQV